VTICREKWLLELDKLYRSNLELVDHLEAVRVVEEGEEDTDTEEGTKVNQNKRITTSRKP